MMTRCPVCGFGVEDYRRTGHLGCPDCYTVFARELDPTAEEPERNNDEPPSLKKARLQKELKLAIEREDYERAATLRDQINALTDNNA
ncbi:MAG: UvrB/UvrC motif-containing protein [Akkermansia sp.]|nr:UvrB/UvrC motif-containing protein [Akkermansia sp.]MBR2313497.1 UvrB/UvrC motif-containing protein [Akkermansia sp.]